MVSKEKSDSPIPTSFTEIIEGFFGTRREETPSYSLLHEQSAYEISEYGEYTCAQVRLNRKGFNKVLSSTEEIFFSLTIHAVEHFGHH